ncbi:MULTISPECIES: transglycosylase SLT domain-containing protein [Rhodanobacter]|uniref:transglycosylase SLT domain-containing protein n=2 Tax=Rhodanobacter TaxID=75309 RepID=UPI001F389CEF|nr:transglycosylase SLT domain-containing protein [Rhodanobacter thiooxydans]UJJ53840.1 transglycosylase SLT domain-containing protein [Rhodanobacter thiooxydans]
MPPTWPLDGWQVTAAAGLWRLVVARIVPWARARISTWPEWAGARRLVAASAIAGVALVLLRIGTHPATGSGSAAVVVGAPATPAPTLRAAPLPVRPVPMLAVAAAVPANAAAVPSAVRSAPVESGRTLLSEVSTMDLMMPIEEPDLDITSRDSLWSQIGHSAGVDPLLLYSIALVESKALYPDGKVAPTPWLFRVNDRLVRGKRHDVQLAMAAASQFGSAVQDVGIMQVYYPMHRDAVRDPLTLLNPRTNITVAAKILRDGMRQTRDRVLGVGYYHSHTPSRARDYGSAVLTVYQRLQAIHRPARRRQAVAR